MHRPHAITPPRLRSFLAIAALLAALGAVASAPASAARTIKAEPSHYWAVTYLGGWHVRAHPDYGKAVFALRRAELGVG